MSDNLKRKRDVPCEQHREEKHKRYEELRCERRERRELKRAELDQTNPEPLLKAPRKTNKTRVKLLMRLPTTDILKPATVKDKLEGEVGAYKQEMVLSQMKEQLRIMRKSFNNALVAASMMRELEGIAIKAVQGTAGEEKEEVKCAMKARWEKQLE